MQQLRVGMFGLLDDCIAWAAFDALAGVHDQCLLGEVAGAGDVMRDEEHAPAAPPRLRRSSRLSMPRRIETSSIETGSSASSTSGPTASARAIDDALALATAQLVGKLLDELFCWRQAHFVQQRQNLCGFLADWYAPDHVAARRVPGDSAPNGLDSATQMDLERPSGHDGDRHAGRPLRAD